MYWEKNPSILSVSHEREDGVQMKLLLEDRLGFETGIRLQDAALTVSENNSFIRVCGHIEALAKDKLSRYLPISVVGELLDHSDCVIDYKIWHPPGNRFHGYATFGICFNEDLEENVMAGIDTVRIYLIFE